MISRLIDEDMLLELNFDNIPNYDNLMDRFKKLACDPEGKYTVCYSWGVTGMVYDKTKVKTKPDSWDALWNKDLSGQILMFNNSRDAMAIAMQLEALTLPTVQRKMLTKPPLNLKSRSLSLKNM